MRPHPRRVPATRVAASLAILLTLLPPQDGTGALAAQGTGMVADSVITSTRLAEGVYLFRAPSALDKWTSSSTVVVIGSDRVVVFDTNTLPSTARSILAGIRELTDQPVRMVINSHWHMDHWSGNGVYADTFPGLQIVSTFQTRQFMARMPAPYFVNSVGVREARAALDAATETETLADGTEATEERLGAMRRDLEERLVFEAEVAATRRVLPTMTYSDSLDISMGGRRLQLCSLTGDAAASTVLYLPQEKILVAGDVLTRQEDGRGAQPWTMNSFAVSEWVAGLKRLETVDADIIVPGQGPPLYDGEYLRTTIELYETLIAETHLALEEGAVRLSDVRSKVDVDAFFPRFHIDDPGLADSFEQHVVMALIRKIIEEAHDGVRPPS